MKRPGKFDGLMHTICVGKGYCGGVHGDRFTQVTDFIPASGEVTADQFVEWVFQAEYGRPYEFASKNAKAHRQAIRDEFVRQMGSDVVRAEDLKLRGN